MQWDKVKNVLIVILLAVNLFLIGNFGVKLWQDYRRGEELLADRPVPGLPVRRGPGRQGGGV